MDMGAVMNVREPTMPVQIRHPYHHGNLKAALLTAARAMLEEKPLSELSLRAVARAAGVSHAAPYRHFASQEELLAEIARSGFLELHDALGAAADVEDRMARIHGLCRTYITFALQHPALMRLMYGSQIADRTAYAGLVEAADTVGAEFCTLLGGRALGLVVWSALHGMAMLGLENVIARGLRQSGPDALIAHAETLLDRLLQTPAANLPS